MEKIFKLKENGTTARTEIVAGLTTFMTMAYIIALNPNLLTNFATGTPLWNAVFMATCIASAIGMLVMAFAANKPFAMAPGMGLNSFFAVVVANIVSITGMGYLESFQAALCIILIEGVFFVILTLFSIREKIVEAIPFGIRIGITPAIGLMLLNVGFGSNAGLYSEKGGPFYVLSTFFGSLTPSVARDTVGVSAAGALRHHHARRRIRHRRPQPPQGQGIRHSRHAHLLHRLLGRQLHFPGHQSVCIPCHRILCPPSRRYARHHILQV